MNKKIKKFIIITSINKPNKVINLFSKWEDWQLVVVGDRKSPADWKYPRVKYLSINDQYNLFGNLAKLIPENTYTRKMLGYIYAVQQGAEVIFESDDDNIPYYFTQKEIQDKIKGKNKNGHLISKKNGWVNIYEEFGENNCWPRGYPIELLKTAIKSKKRGSKYSAKVIQYLVNLDPDVDAIYRMINGREINFKKDLKFALYKGTYCPFNSQATLWFKDAFPLMFFPLGVPDRVTDILRGFISLTCLWAMDSTVEFRSPAVYQERNDHNLLKDFEQENMLYLNSDQLVKILYSNSKSSNLKSKEPCNLFASALRLLANKGFITKKNLECYKLFVNAIK